MTPEDNKTSDLVDQIAADEARRAAAAHKPAGPSFLGRPGVAAASLLLFVVTAAWGYHRMQEPFPPPTLSHEQKVLSARFLLVSARASVEAYRDQRGAYPDELEAVLGTVRSSFVGYLKQDDGYVLATQVDDEVVWIGPTDDADRFLQDGSHVPMPPQKPAVPAPKS